jgi:hypothetical protein
MNESDALMFLVTAASSGSSDCEELCPTLCAKLFPGLAGKGLKLFAERIAERTYRVLGDPMGSPRRLGDDPLNHSQLLQIGRSDPHRLRGISGTI